MGGITVDDLMHAASLTASSTAESWNQFLVGVEKNASYLQENVTQPLANTWSGTASELANDSLNSTYHGLIQQSGELKSVRDTLTTFGGKLAKAQNAIKGPVAAALADGFDVSPDGTVTFPLTATVEAALKRDPAEGAQLESDRGTYQTEIQNALAEANTADDDAATALEKAMPTEGGGVDTTTSWPSTYGSLWSIAQKEYGDGSKWKIIYDANRSVIGSDPSVVGTGVNLQIPAIATTPAQPAPTPAPTTPAPSIAPAGTAPDGPPGDKKTAPDG
jgi:hypothetical protein